MHVVPQIEEVDVRGDCQTLTTALDSIKLDWVVNNAGVLSEDKFGELDYNSIMSQFEVNALGPLRVTEKLRPNISAGSKVFMITSLMGSIQDNTSGGYYGYRMSKAALNMAVMSMSRDLAKEHIVVQALHPGFVATDMTARYGGAGMPPDESARQLIERMQAADMTTTGKFLDYKGNELPW